MAKENVVPTYTGILFNIKKEILQYATTWVNLEDVMANEITQSLKAKYCMTPLT